MRISTRVVIDVETGAVLERESREYEGPVLSCCGGDALAGAKQAAAKQQADAATQMAAIAKSRNDVQQPFEENLVKNGLGYLPQMIDYTGGTLAKSEAPQRAAMNRNLAGFGDTLPSGFKTQTQTDFDTQEGGLFDQNVINALNINEAAKENAAAQLNPLGYYTGSTGATGSVLSAPPVQSGGIGNFLGGAASGLLNAAASNPGGVAFSL
jgi:hypothetical protein